MPLTRALLRVLLALACLLAALPARAACSASNGTASLGAASAVTVAGTPLSTTAASGLACSGSGVLTLLTTNIIVANIMSISNSWAGQPRLHDPLTGHYIPYVICQTSSCASNYGVGSSIQWTSTTFLGLLDLFTGPGGTLPLYIRTVSGSQVAPGTYVSRITVQWNWNVCTVGALILCVTREVDSQIRYIDVQLNVTRDCVIGAPGADFGSAALVGSLDPITQTITIRCSQGTAYSVGIDNGQNASAGQRRMANGSSHIAYDIFFPAGGNSRWGASGAARVSSANATQNPGINDGVAVQSFTYRAEVVPGQSTGAAGLYTDLLTIDISF